MGLVTSIEGGLTLVMVNGELLIVLTGTIYEIVKRGRQ